MSLETRAASLEAGAAAAGSSGREGKGSNAALEVKDENNDEDCQAASPSCFPSRTRVCLSHFVSFFLCSCPSFPHFLFLSSSLLLLLQLLLLTKEAEEQSIQTHTDAKDDDDRSDAVD